jgi:arginine:ornithine antiporter/lysine permease
MVDTVPPPRVAEPVAETPVATPAKMSLPTLTGLVVGAGVFSLPARVGVATGILGSLIAWAVAGTGMLMLAFVFQTLAIRKPDLDSGVFIYAKAGFGDYVGFNSAIGFWASAVAGNTFYWVFISATIGAFFPAFGDGDTVLAVALGTVGVWFFHYLIARGVRDAAVINRIVTVFKILPILVFIVVLFVAFDAGLFADNWIASEVTTNAVIGVPTAFSRPRNSGKSSLCAGMYITSAAIRVQAR